MNENVPTLEARGSKTPPFLILATLLFWGWQSDCLIFGAVTGVVLESARFIKVRVELAEEDFRRIWNFCVLLTLVLAVYIFTTNQEGGGFSGLFHAPAAVAGRNAGIATVHTATTMLRWIPMALFLFVAAQNFSEHESVPLSAISLVFRLRRRKSDGAKPERNVDVSYPYFMLCLFSAGIHSNEGRSSYFWGQGVLLAWALWPLRSRRFGISIWLCTFAVAVGIGFFGQYGIGQLQRLLEGYNAQWLAQFFRQKTDVSRSITSIGEIGNLKLSARIVIRLMPKSGGSPPTYLREASYRNYRSQNWFAGGSPNDFMEVAHDLNNDNWDLLAGKAHTSSASIACFLDGRSQETGEPEGLLPLPTGSRRLENLPALTLKENKTGAVLATGQGSLIMFDAFYGPGTTIDSPPDTNWDYLVPTNETPALDRAISEMKISGKTDAQKLLAVAQFFSRKFAYSTWLGPDKLARTNETGLARFLLDSRSGHCEYFATAAVLLLRELGIPARYAVGYYVHENSGRGFVVRERDAHAWCLAWNQRTKTWNDFDTTPGSWVATEGQRATFFERFSDFWSWIGFEAARLKLWWSQTNSRRYILWALIPALALLLYQIVFRRKRKRKPQKQYGKGAAEVSWPGLDSEFYLLESKLAEHGLPRRPGEVLSDWLAHALAEPALVDLRAPLQQLLHLHYRHRFDPHGLSGKERGALARQVKICLDSLVSPETMAVRHGFEP